MVKTLFRWKRRFRRKPKFSRLLRPSFSWRAGWDSNPRFAAPQAAVLVLARLPALEEAFSFTLIMGRTWPRNHISSHNQHQFHMPNRKVPWSRHVHLYEMSEERVSDDTTIRNEVVSRVCRMRGVLCRGLD